MQNFCFSNCLVGGPANNSLAVRTSKEISSSPNKEPAERLSQETRERLEVKMERIGRLVSKDCRPGLYILQSQGNGFFKIFRISIDLSKKSRRTKSNILSRIAFIVRSIKG